MGRASPTVCPACLPLPDWARAVGDSAKVEAPLRRYEFALPQVHCAACMTTVEDGLMGLDGVAAARVNLTLKRVTLTAVDVPGMEDMAIQRLAAIGYTAQPLDSATLAATRQDAEGRDLLARIAVAGFAAMNVMLLSVSVWSGATDTTRDLLHWVSALIAVPAVMFAGVPFFRHALSALRVGRLNMDVPISLAMVLALAVSLSETIEGGEAAWFDAALTLAFFLLIGRYLDHRTRAAARSAAAELAALEVPMARRITAEGASEAVPLDAVRQGDILAVAPGARVPVDGRVTTGHSELDTALLTGETLPVAIGPGAAVRAGTLNLSGALQIEATGVGEETLLKQIMRLVETAECARNRYTSLAERAARIYAPLVHLLALSAFIVWGLTTGDWRLAVNIAAAVLIITCPCALGLAVPAVLAAASGRLFRAGVLLKDGVALERLAEVDTVVFDKTGTLTRGDLRVSNADRLQGDSRAVARALANASQHPLARAMAAALDGPVAQVDDIAERPGFGVEGVWRGKRVALGRAEWLGVRAPQTTTASWLAIGDAAPLAVMFEDQPRDEAAALIATLAARGLDLHLLSGDGAAPVAQLAGAVGLTQWQAGATPAEKVAYLADLAAQGRRVLMVGDGLNDTAALAAAHVSISPASAADASRTSADMIIIGNDLRQIALAHEIACVAKRRILQNFGIAAAYNLISVPLALAGLATPLMAALAMSSSSIVVSLNAMRLGWRK